MHSTASAWGVATSRSGNKGRASRVSRVKLPSAASVNRQQASTMDSTSSISWCSSEGMTNNFVDNQKWWTYLQMGRTLRSWTGLYTQRWLLSHLEGHCNDHLDRSHRREQDVLPWPYIVRWRSNSHRPTTFGPDAVHEARVHPPGSGWMELRVIDDADDYVSVELVHSSNETLWCKWSCWTCVMLVWVCWLAHI